MWRRWEGGEFGKANVIEANEIKGAGASKAKARAAAEDHATAICEGQG